MRVGVEEKIKEEEGGLGKSRTRGRSTGPRPRERNRCRKRRRSRRDGRMGRWARDGGKGREEWAVG